MMIPKISLIPRGTQGIDDDGKRGLEIQARARHEIESCQHKAATSIAASVASPRTPRRYDTEYFCPVAVCAIT